MMPSQNVGTDWPMSAPPTTTLSGQRRRIRAANEPSSVPPIVAMRTAAPASSSV
jgi:hypothetical protein